MNPLRNRTFSYIISPDLTPPVLYIFNNYDLSFSQKLIKY